MVHGWWWVSVADQSESVACAICQRGSHFQRSRQEHPRSCYGSGDATRMPRSLRPQCKWSSTAIRTRLAAGNGFINQCPINRCPRISHMELSINGVASKTGGFFTPNDYNLNRSGWRGTAPLWFIHMVVGCYCLSSPWSLAFLLLLFVVTHNISNGQHHILSNLTHPVSKL